MQRFLTGCSIRFSTRSGRTSASTKSRAVLAWFVALNAIVASAAQAQQAKPRPLPPVTMAAARDSFLIIADDKVVGGTIYSVTAGTVDGKTGFMVKESTTMPNIGNQLTEVFVDEAGHVVKVLQSGKMAGQDIGLNLKYALGKVSGTVKLPGKPLSTVEKPVPANVVDDNMLQALLPLLPWTTSSSWTVPVFSGGMNSLTSQTLEFTDEVPVTVPGGKFDAYRVELRSDNGVIAFYVSKAAPHKVLKIVPAGAPFEIVRAN